MWGSSTGSRERIRSKGTGGGEMMMEGYAVGKKRRKR